MNTNEHPKAREARERSAIRTNQKEKIRHAILTHGIHFHTVGKYTFCYRVDKRNVLEISSSIRHPCDKHDPHVGRMQALARFAASNRMHLRMPNDLKSPRDFLQLTFSE